MLYSNLEGDREHLGGKGGIGRTVERGARRFGASREKTESGALRGPDYRYSRNGTEASELQ